MDFVPPESAYVHVPFCRHRCGYCDFSLVTGRDDLIDPFLDALEAEMQRAENSAPLATLFIGGGTPSLLDAPQLRRLFQIIHSRFAFQDDAEISIECNPFGLTADRVAVIADAGVNRVSLGVQSFDARELAVLERDHLAADVDRSLELVRNRIANISFDLIFGIPGQSVSDWQRTLDAAVAREPAHMSAYGLTIEKGTAYWSRVRKGSLIRVAEKAEREMFELAMQILPAAGYAQYELSNYARDGFACVHNQQYWKGKPHWGFGPGAAEFLVSKSSGMRRLNHRSPLTWLKRLKQGQSPAAESEILDQHQLLRERLVFGLRMIEGTDFTTDDAELKSTISALGDRGWLQRTGNRIQLTHEGRMFADSVAVELI